MLYGHVCRMTAWCKALVVFLLQAKSLSFSLFLPPLALLPYRSLPLHFNLGCVQPVLCNLHKLASEICAYPRALLRQSELAVQRE